MRVAATLAVCVIFVLVEVSLANRDGDRQSRRRQQSSSSTVAPVACPRRRPCNKDCGTRGFMRGDNGCELCACNPAVACPAIECPDAGGLCPFGWKEDENGCRLCECKVNPRCTGDRPMCMIFCPNGFINGPDGCPTCTCFDPATASQLPAPAPAAEGAAATTPQPPARTRPGQRNQQGGHQRGGGRAGTAPPTVSLHSASASNDNVTCGPICRMYCQYGMQTGPDGCPVCVCNESPASTTETGRRGDRGGRHQGGRGRGRGPQCALQPVCAMYCPNGNRRDHNGCILCECFQPGDATFRVNADSSLQCPTLRCHQTARCAHGFATDSSSGCPLCTCKRA